MMAVVDANYQFKYVSVGAQGGASDAQVFAESDFKQALNKNLLNIPAAKLLPDSDTEVPFMFIGDDAFSLSSNFMKPYSSHQLDRDQRVFNYRLSRGRRAAENGFGLFANRWRVFVSTILLNPDKVQKMVLACVCLHNYLREVRSETYKTPGLDDAEDADHRLVPGSWRNDGLGAMLPLQPGKTGNNSEAGKEVRDKLRRYFVSPAGQVPWQEDLI